MGRRRKDDPSGGRPAGAERWVAETGIDMARFGTASRLAVWAGVAPGNDASAGKQRSGRTRTRNQPLRTVLTQLAHAGAPMDSLRAGVEGTDRVGTEAARAAPRSASFHLGQRCLQLGQPEGHLHDTVEAPGPGPLGLGLLLMVYPGIQRPQAVVAVGLERAHSQLFGQDESLAVMGFDLLGIWRLTLCSDLT
jgi:Transposase IS116/IS110/IS902 family